MGPNCEALLPLWQMGPFAHPAIDEVCVETVADRATWERISIEESGYGMVRSTKYFIPWDGGAPIPNALLNSPSLLKGAPSGNGIGPFGEPLHLMFARTYLTDYFVDEYVEVYDSPALKTGGIAEFQSEDGARSFAYTLYGAQKMSCDDQKRVHARMLSLFALRPLSRLVSDPSLQAFGVLAPQVPPGCSIPVQVFE